MKNAKTRVYNRPWRYALAMLGMSITGFMYTTYGTFFYSDLIGLPMKSIAMGSVFFAIWDAFNDPLTGYLSDRTRTRFGRRKPWLMAAIPVFTLAPIVFFSPPEALGKGIALAVFFTFFLMLTETASTIVGVNYHSLLPELFRQTSERNRANSIRQALELVGMIVGVSLTPLLADAIGYQYTTVILALMGGLLLVYSVLGCKEREDFSQTRPPKLFKSLLELAKNRNFWFVAFANFFYQATSALLLAGIPFFIKYTLSLEDSMTTILTAAVFVTAIPSIYVWYRMVNKFGSIKVWRTALAWLGLSLVPMFFAGSIVFASIVGAFIGIGLAGVICSLDMVYSELIEIDAAKYGVRREATFFAVISFIIRLSGLVRSAVLFMLFWFFGFESGDNPGDRAAEAAKFMMVVFPVLLMAFSVLMSLLLRKNKTEKIAQIEADGR